MRNEQSHDFEPWDQDTYRTGSTKPPKSRGGFLAVLLVVVILLFGIVSILGIMNIKLFKEFTLDSPDDSLPIIISGPEETAESLAPADLTEATEPTVDLSDSALGVENIPQAGGLSLQAIYEKLIPSVVSIACSSPSSTSSGTGVILSEEGYIVTNCHVVEDARQVQVLLSDQRVFEATLVGMDAISDLAVLRIHAEDLVPAELGDSSALRVGDTVVAIGDPLGIELRGTMTDGIVSAINRDIDMGGRTMNLIQTNAALNFGNSGGPLVNCYGQVVGINTMKMGDSMSTAGVEGLGFAIPSTTVAEIVNQLIDQGFVSGRPSLGLTLEALSIFDYFYFQMPQGLHITAVAQGSSAAEAGIAPGDVLVSMDGLQLSDVDTFYTKLYTYTPGDKVELVIYREYKYYTVTLTVDEASG